MEGFSLDIEEILSTVTPLHDGFQDIEQAREIIRTNLITPNPAEWICRESDAQVIIYEKFRPHFDFKVKQCDSLMKYFKEIAPVARKPKAPKEVVFNQSTGKLEEVSGDEAKKVKVDPRDVDQDEKGIAPELIGKAEKMADRIMSRGDPIKYILKTVAKKHIGDEKTEEAICVSIAGQSCLNTAGVQISVNGESGSGKSDAFIKHLHLVPNMWKRKTSLSAKALFYMKLRAGTMIFSDDVDMDPEMAEVFKQATTNYQETTYRETVKEQDIKPLSIAPRINWYLTSVESHVSDQVMNRRLTVETITSPEQKKLVFDKQRALEAQGINPNEVTFRVLVCRRIYAMIKKQLFNVRIPFAERISFNDVSNSRIFPLFCDMIKGYAVFNYKQRKIDEKGNLIAQVEDFECAKVLFMSRAENTVTKLTTPEKQIVNFIIGHQKEIGCSINEIAAGTKLDTTKINRTINGRTDRKNDAGGLLEKVKGMRKEETTDTEYIRDTEGEHSVTIGSKGRKATRYFIDGMSKLENYASLSITLED